jgi:zinc-binding alcohol dehydrogenase/oxidoreductase
MALFSIPIIHNLLPKSGEVRIKVLAAALNHRDVWITQGQYAGIKYPTILGSDGVGIVESVGEGVSSELIGQTVIINPNNQWGDNQRHQSNNIIF